MKRFAAILIAACLIALLSACGSSQTGGREGESPSMGNGQEAAVDKNDPDERETTADAGQKEDEEMGGATDNNNTHTNILVAYFSATGTTKKLAEYAADITGADLYESVPAEPYTDADLDWGDKKSRTSIEMNDDSARPAINGSVPDMGQYDIVFLGYPIWWGLSHISDV